MANAVKRALLPGLILLILVLMAVSANPPAPHAQPIAFPHERHVNLKSMDCTFCHPSTDRSGKAGMPPLSVCTDCHVQDGVPTVRADRPEVKKLIAYWRLRRPIAWAPVDTVPPHVHFPHRRHVTSGMLCQDCHGAVLPRRDIGLVQPLKMTWCVDCHEQEGARSDCVACHFTSGVVPLTGMVR